MLLVGGAMASAFYFMTLQLQVAERYTPLQTGVAVLPLSLAILTAGVLGPKVQHRVVVRTTFLKGMLIAGIGLATAAVLFAQGSALLAIATTPLFGSGVALTLTGAASAVTGAVDPADAGFASAMISINQHVGAVIVLAALVPLVERGAMLTHAPTTFVLGLAGAALACTIACIATLAIPQAKAVRAGDPTIAA